MKLITVAASAELKIKRLQRPAAPYKCGWTAGYYSQLWTTRLLFHNFAQNHKLNVKINATISCLFPIGWAFLCKLRSCVLSSTSEHVRLVKAHTIAWKSSPHRFSGEFYDSLPSCVLNATLLRAKYHLM